MFVKATLRARREKKGDPVRNYLIDVHDPARRPDRKRISLGTTDRSTAARRFQDLEARLRDGTWDPWRQAAPDDDLTVQEAVERFVAARRADGLAAGSLDTYASVLGSLVSFLAPGYPLKALADADLDRWLDAAPRADATRTSYRQRVRIFAAWALAEGLLRMNPVSLPKGRGKRARQKVLPKAMTAEEERRLLAAIESDGLVSRRLRDESRWLLAAVRFALGTGLRRGEVVALRWGDVDLKGRSVRVAVREDWSPKSGRERTVPLVGDALAVVEHLAAERGGEGEGEPVFKGAGGGALCADYLSKRFTHYRVLAGLHDRISFHGLRHTYASRLVQGGASVYKVQALLGHASVRTTEQYASLTGSDVRAEVERVFGAGARLKEASEAGVEALREENERLRLRLEILERAAHAA